ncbi:hypothetical protein ACHAXA_000126 [Cyclostephanos tholiformis]|uniref:Uncharacterized protein n=1 Tax=Cyclostephanos tholiformis TaxID=382380 RepID=A0ABD3RY19_9STRA
MLGHHDTTTSDQQSSPPTQSRGQLLAIMCLMIGYALHSATDAGIFVPLNITRGTFPGGGRKGEFVHKEMTRDYAAVDGTLLTVATDLGMIGPDGEISDVLHDDVDGDDGTAGLGGGGGDLLYAVLLDDPGAVPGGMTRFLGGALLVASSDDRRRKAIVATSRRLLIDANERISTGMVKGDGDIATSRHVLYEFGGRLPSVIAGMACHPYSGGIWSSLVLSYKVRGEGWFDLYILPLTHIGGLCLFPLLRVQDREGDALYPLRLFDAHRVNKSINSPVSLPSLSPARNLANTRTPSLVPPHRTKIQNTTKIIPKFMKYAREHGESGKSPIVISTCSARQRMCTYYTPLEKRDEFFMGRKTTEEYAKEFVHAGILERIGIRFDGSWGTYASDVFRGIKRAVGLGGGKVEGKSEL